MAAAHPPPPAYPILLTWEEVQQATAGPHGDFRTAGRGQGNKLLKEVRTDMSGGLTDDNIRMVREQVRDLSHSHIDFWRPYLGSLPRFARQVIGPGVVFFGFQFFLDEYDSNTKQSRGDFVVVRSDMTVVRLHPDKSADAKPLIGDSLAGPWRLLENDQPHRGKRFPRGVAPPPVEGGGVT